MVEEGTGLRRRTALSISMKCILPFLLESCRILVRDALFHRCMIYDYDGWS